MDDTHSHKLAVNSEQKRFDSALEGRRLSKTKRYKLLTPFDLLSLGLCYWTGSAKPMANAKVSPLRRACISTQLS